MLTTMECGKLYILWLISICFVQVNCQERELALKLLRNYSEFGRPIDNALVPIKINVDAFRLIGVEYIDELTATLSLQGWLVFVSSPFSTLNDS